MAFSKPLSSFFVLLGNAPGNHGICGLAFKVLAAFIRGENEKIIIPALQRMYRKKRGERETTYWFLVYFSLFISPLCFFVEAE